MLASGQQSVCLNLTLGVSLCLLSALVLINSFLQSFEGCGGGGPRGWVSREHETSLICIPEMVRPTGLSEAQRQFLSSEAL